MNKSNLMRTISAVLCALLLLGAVPLTGAAVPAPLFKLDSIETYPGETVQFALSVENNPGIISAMLHLSYDPDLLTLINVENGTVFANEYFMCGGDLTAVPFNIYWLDALRTDNNTDDGALAILTFRVAADALPCQTAVSVSYDAISTMDVQLNPVPFSVENGVADIQYPGCTVTLDANGGVCGIAHVTAFYGEPYGVLPTPVQDGFRFDGWFLSDGTPVTQTTLCASGDDHTLTAHWTPEPVSVVSKSGSTAVIDEARGFIYGLDFNLTADDLTRDYLAVNGNGHLEYSTIAAGTGTIVSVVSDSTGETAASYEIVVFGDLDGDGMLGATDFTQMRAFSAQMIELPAGSAKEFAADVTHDGMVNSSDYARIRSAAAQMATINQTP